MRILVTGKVGQVASALAQYGETIHQGEDLEIIFIGRPEIDLADPISLKRKILELRPDLVVSAAAYTLVDKAEEEKDLARIINAEAPRYIAEACAQLDITIIHLSTDYVFDGEKSAPYIESDETGPKSAYGISKLAGELAVMKFAPKHVILRTSWVYSAYGNNFVKTMLRLGETKSEINVVNDQFGSPTHAPEIARAIIAIAYSLKNNFDQSMFGVFHLTGSGDTNWADFAKKIFEIAFINCQINPIPSAEYPTLAQRPKNSVLNCDKIQSVYSIKLDNWEKSLKDCILSLSNR